jgi:hypothetical protein
MWDLALPLLVMVGWFAIFRWVLPAMGIPTCMSGGCSVPSSHVATGNDCPDGLSIDHSHAEGENQ